MSDEGPSRKKSKTINFKRFQYQWLDDNPSWRTWVKNIPNDPSKFFCKACKTILACGLSEIKRHSVRESHLQNIKKLNLDHNIDDTKLTNRTSSIDSDNSGQPEMTQSSSNLKEDFNFNERVKIAEIRLATFFVEKDVPFSISSDLLLLMKDIGKESGILQAMSLGRQKLTQILNNVVCRKETDRISKVLREHSFSVYEQETSDVTNNKWLPLMVRYVDPETLHVRCELLQMIHLDTSDCSATKIFESFKNELLKKNIPLKLIISLACNNASVMVNKSSSFKARLIERNPNLVTLPCVCRSSALAAKEACQIIPQDCERFIKGISKLINSGSKKAAIYREFNASFENFSLTTLKYAETRWLTRHKYIQRILEMWDNLGRFLMEQSCKNIYPAGNLHKIFQNPVTKAYFFFLEFTLNAFNKYNTKFQARESLIHELQPSSIKLLLWFLRKFIKPALLESETFDHTIKDLNFSDRGIQLPLEEIDFGFKCNDYLKEQLDKKIFCKEDMDLIRESCLQFYVIASEQIRKCLPTNDMFLTSVAVFESKSALFDCDRHSTFRKVLHVNSKLGGLIDEKLIENEWKSLYEIDSVTKAKWSELSFDDMWTQIGFFSTDEGKLNFPNLRSLLSFVRTLPHSNAEADRVFSVIPDVKIKKRNNMSIETFNSICVVRYALKNSNKTVHTMAVTREHLNLMNAQNIYTRTKSKKESNLTLRAQDLHESDLY